MGYHHICAPVDLNACSDKVTATQPDNTYLSTDFKPLVQQLTSVPLASRIALQSTVKSCFPCPATQQFGELLGAKITWLSFSVSQNNLPVLCLHKHSPKNEQGLRKRLSSNDTELMFFSSTHNKEIQCRAGLDDIVILSVISDIR